MLHALSLLAQTSDTSSFTAAQLFAWLGIVGFLLTIYLLVRKAFSHDPPLHREYFTKADQELFKGVINMKLDKQDENRSEIIAEQKTQGLQITALQAESAHHTTALAEIKTEQLTAKRENKEDGTAVQNRITEVLVSLGEIKGGLNKK